MKLQTVADLLKTESKSQEVEVKGWVRTFRANRFIALNDGSTLNNIQCVVDFEKTEETLLKRVTTGAAIYIKGELYFFIKKMITIHLIGLCNTIPMHR